MNKVNKVNKLIIIIIIIIMFFVILERYNENKNSVKIIEVEVETSNIEIKNKNTYIEEMEMKYNIPSGVLYNLIKVESGFNPDAVGDNGNSIGFCQIQPRWWSKEAEKLGLDIYSPIDNIEMGAYILNKLMNKYTDIRMVLSAYNSGNPVDGLDYADKILS